MSRTAQDARILEIAFRDQEQEWAENIRAIAVAKRHLAQMTPERRAQLEKEWTDA